MIDKINKKLNFGEIVSLYLSITNYHGFKNRTGPTGWTVGRSPFRFGPVTRPDGDQTEIGPLEPAVQPVNRPVLREPVGSNDFFF